MGEADCIDRISS